MLNEDSITELKQSLRGRVIQPGDADFDEARKVYNGMIHKKPRLIARCADVADVIQCVNFGRDNNLLVSIRGGGHNAGGLGICDDGLVIDLAPIKYTRVDPAGSHRHSRWRMRLGRCRSCYTRIWTRDAERNHLYHWCWRINARRWSRSSHPQMRIEH